MPADPLAAARHLDGPRAVELLAAAAKAAGATLESATRRSVHHRAGRSRSDVYDAVLEFDGQRRSTLLVAHVDASPLPQRTFTVPVSGGRIAVWRFPNDPFLPGLAPAVHRGRVRELLDQLAVPDGAVRLRTRAYRPSRRGVVEVTIDGPVRGRVLYLKVLTGSHAADLAEVHQHLGDHLPVPRVIGVAARQGIVAFEALSGVTLREALRNGGAVPEPEELVDLSRRFAASDLHSRRDPRRFADPSRHVGLLSRLVPDAADRIERVAAATGELEGPLVAVHGDLHPGQLLLTGGEPTGLLDVDGAGAGLIAEDAGNLIARLEVVGHLAGANERDATTYAAAVADAYRPLVGDDALRIATAGAWLSLATGPHRAQDANWETSTRRRIDRAVEVLDAAG